MRYAAFAEPADALELLGVEVLRPVYGLEQPLVAAGRLVDRREANDIPLDVLGFDLRADLRQLLVEDILDDTDLCRLGERVNEGRALRVGDRAAVRHDGDGVLRRKRAGEVEEGDRQC